MAARQVSAKEYLDGMFGAQEALVVDLERRIAALCTRRAGKTEGIAKRVISHAEDHPGGASVYITGTKGVARRNLGKKLARYRKAFNLPIKERERDGQLLWVHDNGHEIWLAGCKDKSECEKFRGEDQGYSLAIIDEAQSFPMPQRRRITSGDEEEVEENRELLEYLVNDVLDPALLDTDGQLIITGTPGVLPQGFFWEITTGEGKVEQWKTHKWGVFDNTYLPGARGWLEAKMARNGWDWDHPTVQREWLGRWVADKSALVYTFDSQKNGWYPDTQGKPCWLCLPGDKHEWHFVLGIDLGHDDATAFVLTAARRGFPHVWVLRCWGGSEMTTSQRAAEWHRTKTALARDGFELHQTVIDTGGLGKSIALDLNSDYGVPCEAAEKKHKAAAIRRVRNAMDGGLLRINVFECHPLTSEMSVLPWNDDHTGHMDGYSDHWCDGLLYANREHATWEAWDHEPPKPGTPEAIDQEMEDYRLQLERDMLEDERKRGSEAW